MIGGKEGRQGAKEDGREGEKEFAGRTGID